MGVHERSKPTRWRRRAAGEALERISEIALTQSAVRAALTERCHDRRETAPPGFAAALARGGEWTFSDGRAWALRADPDADPDEVWAELGSWRGRHVA
jgi:hypothetical protein